MMATYGAANRDPNIFKSDEFRLDRPQEELRKHLRLDLEDIAKCVTIENEAKLALEVSRRFPNLQLLVIPK